MTSRQRVLAALEHRQPDRVPIDFSGHRSSGIAALAYAKLRRFLHLENKPLRIYDLVQQLAIVDEDVLELFDVDTVEMGRGFLLRDSDWKDWVLPDGTPCQVPFYIHMERRGDDWFITDGKGLDLGVQRKGCLYFEQTTFPSLEKGITGDLFEDLEERVAQTVWGGVPSPGAHLDLDAPGLVELRKGAQALRESTDRAILGLFGGNMFELPQWLYRMDNYFSFLKLFPDDVVRLSESLCSMHLGNLEKWLRAVGDFIDVIVFGDDLGGQERLLISPEMYRTFIKPYHKKLWMRAKELSPAKVMLHCCGDVSDIFPDLIEAGLDAINPVQISCPGMNPHKIKERYGKEITFWGGGCDTRYMLPSAVPAEVKRHVKQQISIWQKEGGFVFQQVHNILADVPPGNVAAMFEAVRKWK
jgi:uroporphyrinogen decarboxylase